MKNNVSLTIVAIEDHETKVFGKTECVSVAVQTANGDVFTAMPSLNLLRKAGITQDQLDDTVGCTILVEDSVDLEGVVTSAQERVDLVLDGTRPFLLLSKANASIKKSALFLAEQTKNRSRIQAELLISKERELKEQKLRDAQARLLAKAAQRAEQRELAAAAQEQGTNAETTAEPNEQQSDEFAKNPEETVAELETNMEDAPF